MIKCIVIHCEQMLLLIPTFMSIRIDPNLKNEKNALETICFQINLI